MRVLLSTYGSRGDVEPMAALGAELQAMGAEAVLSAPGDEEFVELAARAGVRLAPAFMPVRAWIEAAQSLPRDISVYAEKMIGAQYEAIGAAAEGCDVIVATGLMPSAAAAQCLAEKRGLAYAHVALCPLYLPSEHHRPVAYRGHPLPANVTEPRALWALNAEHMNAIFGGAINGLRARIGLSTSDNVRDLVFTDRPLLASDRLLWPWKPTGLCDAQQTGAWVLPDARPLPADLEAFLDAGEAPVYVGFGSIALQSTKDAAKAAIAAIRAHGARIVLARGWGDNAPLDDGEDCFVVGEVNQQALFRRCAGVVHHGGAGTTNTAARAGVPQVIAPQIADQPSWAARVAELGIGVALESAAPGTEAMAKALKSALSGEMRAQAQSVRGMIQADGGAATASQMIKAWS